MDKGIGFNRNIYLAWLDAAAAFRAESDDPAEIRARLEPVVEQRIRSAVNRRKAIDILINIWVKSGEIEPALYEDAVARHLEMQNPGDRIWFHYGLTTVYYAFFREVTVAIGQIGRTRERIKPAMVKQRLASARGQLGSLEKAVERIMFSLRDWGILAASEERYAVVPRQRAFAASDPGLEAWLLACALHAHPAEELPFADLLRLPELFPFRFTLGVGYLREHSRFSVQRQGSGWDMVRLKDAQEGR
jgi:hypothetical protein